MKQLYGLLGHPLGHSFSRRYFTEKFAREGIEAEYLNFDCAEASALRGIVTAHPALRGLNVTIPHKQAVIPLLDELSPEAGAIGAVNVVAVLPDGRLRGYNSDVTGFRLSLRPLLAPGHRRALVLGTGGASRAVAFGLRAEGLEPRLVSRTPGKADLAYGELTPEIIDAHRVIVNCTPAGMYPRTDEAPPLPYGLLGPGHLLYDLVYNPEETLFMRRGRARGATVKNGLDMLRLQAEAGWRLWQEAGR